MSYRTRVPHKSVPQECPTRVFHKSVLQGVPQESASVSHKGFPKECVLQERPTTVFPTRVLKIVWVFVFEYVLAFGFVGSILFLFRCKPRILPKILKVTDSTEFSISTCYCSGGLLIATQICEPFGPKAAQPPRRKYIGFVGVTI